MPSNHYIVSEVIDFREKGEDQYEYKVKWEGYERYRFKCLIVFFCDLFNFYLYFLERRGLKAKIVPVAI